MTDIAQYRADKSGPEAVASVRRLYADRFLDVARVDAIISADSRQRAAQYELERANTESNKLQKEIGKYSREKTTPPAELMEQKAALDARLPELEATAQTLASEVHRLMSQAPNIIGPGVPIDDNEDNNVVVTRSERLAKPRPPGMEGNDAKVLNHVEIMHRLGIIDTDRGLKVAGHRGYFLRGLGVRLNQALINFGLDFLSRHSYIPIQVPFFMKKEVMAACCQLEQFAEELYRVVEGPDPATDKFLIATSEQPISAYHMKENLDERQLPLKYAGLSTCFRKEAGSHGADTLGIFRIHQFEKIEQFVITTPEQSWAAHEELRQLSEEFYRQLELPYRVVSIVSGALNNAAAKKYDLEAWFPASKNKFGTGESGVYRELVSCSNCTDHQSRRLGIKLGLSKKQGARSQAFVHMLNSTLVATERTMCCCVENWQTPHGITIPPVLRPYLNGAEFFPYETTTKPQKARGTAAHATTSTAAAAVTAAPPAAAVGVPAPVPAHPAAVAAPAPAAVAAQPAVHTSH